MTSDAEIIVLPQNRACIGQSVETALNSVKYNRSKLNPLSVHRDGVARNKMHHRTILHNCMYFSPKGRSPHEARVLAAASRPTVEKGAFQIRSLSGIKLDSPLGGG